MNLYGYAGGDPINFSDPFGLCPVPLACLVGGLAGMAVEVGAQAVTGDWNGPRIAAAGALGAMSGGLATASRVGGMVKMGAMAALGAAEAAAGSQAETSADLAVDMGFGAVVGSAGFVTAEIAQSAKAVSPVAQWIRKQLQTRANSVGPRMDMIRRLGQLDENAIAAGMVVGGAVNLADGRGR
jgi:hypothetical protein